MKSEPNLVKNYRWNQMHTTTTPIFRLVKLAILILSLATAIPANSAALYQTSLQVTLSVSDSSGGNLQIFSIIDDDGADPSTTYSLVDPAGSLGSSASSLAEVTFSGSDPMNFVTSTNGNAVGIDPATNISAFSTAVIKGGFFLFNDGTNPIDAIFTVAWSWSTSIAADNDTLESVIALTNLTVFQDDVLAGVLLSELFQTPSSVGGSDSGEIQSTLTVDPSGTRWFSVALETTGLAQSTAETQSVPEPGIMYLLLLTGFFVIPFSLRS